MAAVKKTNKTIETNENKSTQTTFKLSKFNDAHISSINCVDWSASLPNRLISGSDDKFIKLWDLRSKKCGSTLNLTKFGEISSICSNQWQIWCSTSDCQVYQFDTRKIRQQNKEPLLKCKDEISQITYNKTSNSLFIADDTGRMHKYDLKSQKCTESILFHENAVCTSITTLPGMNVGFCGGTDSMLCQWDLNLKNAIACSMVDMLEHSALQKKNDSSNNALMVNPPFVYGLDSKIIDHKKSDNSALVAFALGNGSVGLYCPNIEHKEAHNKGDDDDKKIDESNQEDIIESDEAVACIELHQSAACDIGFGYNNDWLVSIGTDSFLMISTWDLGSDDVGNDVLDVVAKFKIKHAVKPNAMICTGNDNGQIIVADVSNTLSMYSLKS